MVADQPSSDIRYRVYYKDTDAGGVMYHATYLEVFEIGRTELIRKRSSKNSKKSENNPQHSFLKDSPFLFPVTNLQVDYLAPALYDDELLLKTALAEVSPIKLFFEYQLYKIIKSPTPESPSLKLIARATTINVAVDREKLRPRRISKELRAFLISD